MPKCTFKMQFQDTFAWMICLNSLFFLRERQPTVMKFVWEKTKGTFGISIRFRRETTEKKSFVTKSVRFGRTELSLRLQKALGEI